MIKLILGGREVARVEEGIFKNTLICNHPFAPDFKKWYADCFYNLENANTFEQRYNLVKLGQYFCFSKPALKLEAIDLPRDNIISDKNVSSKI